MDLPGSEALYQSPNALWPHYRRFRVAERLLLTGHSHQAWPDCGFEGQARAWEDAAELVDEKWPRAFEVAERVRAGYARLLDDPDGHYALASSTHDFLVRFLSALPLRERPRIVTTDGEYYSMRRQLDRLEEEGVEVVRVPSDPPGDVAARLVEALDDRTAAVMVSSVFFLSARIVPGLGAVMEPCRKVGAELFIDAYHALNVLPFSLRAEGLQGAYVTGAGYKYCQLGEGNAFLRTPPDCALRPVATGWFAEFEGKEERKTDHRVRYAGGSNRFAGATYDPTSHYRAAAVLDFFEEQQLTPGFLRAVSRHQVGLLARLFDELDLDPADVSRDRSVSLEGIGGFLALRSPRAGDLQRELAVAGVLTDSRGEVLRLGPAPYLCDDQLVEAMGILGSVARR